MALPDTFDKLKELLTQDQFELLLDEEKKEEKQKIRLVYLMNDAVESFLVFHEARLTGEYRKEYEGELVSSLSEKEKDEIPGPRYVLVVHQGETVVTVFFEALSLEVNCYDYGEVGHFWMKGWEYLRLLEYRLAILRDKRDYLGESFCSREEVALSELTAFPPLNYCCYPSVSQEYIVPREEPWTPNKEALAVMEGMAEKVGDRSFLFWLGIYRRFSFCFLARFLANRLHKKRSRTARGSSRRAPESSGGALPQAILPRDGRPSRSGRKTPPVSRSPGNPRRYHPGRALHHRQGFHRRQSLCDALEKERNEQESCGGGNKRKLKSGGIFYAGNKRQPPGYRKHYPADDLAGHPFGAGTDRKRTL